LEWQGSQKKLHYIHRCLPVGGRPERRKYQKRERRRGKCLTSSDEKKGKEGLVLIVTPHWNLKESDNNRRRTTVNQKPKPEDRGTWYFSKSEKISSHYEGASGEVSLESTCKVRRDEKPLKKQVLFSERYGTGITQRERESKNDLEATWASKKKYHKQRGRLHRFLWAKIPLLAGRGTTTNGGPNTLEQKKAENLLCQGRQRKTEEEGENWPRKMLEDGDP